MAAATDPRERLRLFADDVTARLERVGPLLGVLAAPRRASRRSPSSTRGIHEDRLRNLRTLPAALARNGPLRVDEETAAETIWALASPDLHALLTGVRGWKRERYTAWLADSLAAILLHSAERSGSSIVLRAAWSRSPPATLGDQLLELSRAA